MSDIPAWRLPLLVISFSACGLQPEQDDTLDTEEVREVAREVFRGFLRTRRTRRVNSGCRSAADDGAGSAASGFRSNLEALAARWLRPLCDNGPPMQVHDAKTIPRPGEKHPDMREYLNAKGKKAFAAVGRINCFDPTTETRNFSTATVVSNYGYSCQQ